MELHTFVPVYFCGTACGNPHLLVMQAVANITIGSNLNHINRNGDHALINLLEYEGKGWKTIDMIKRYFSLRFRDQ